MARVVAIAYSERVVRADLETYILPADLRHFADVDPDWQSKRLARGGRPVVSNGGVGLYVPAALEIVAEVDLRRGSGTAVRCWS
jgi:hypothetical protein